MQLYGFSPLLPSFFFVTGKTLYDPIESNLVFNGLNYEFLATITNRTSDIYPKYYIISPPTINIPMNFRWSFNYSHSLQQLPLFTPHYTLHSPKQPNTPIKNRPRLFQMKKSTSKTTETSPTPLSWTTSTSQT